MTKNSDRALKKDIYNSRLGSIPALSTKKTAKSASNEAFFILEKKPVPKNVPSKKGHRKRFLRTHKPYKLPTIVKAKGDWFVKYFYELPNHAGKFKEFRVRDGINYYDNAEDKEKAIHELCADIKYSLEKNNFNPFEESEDDVKTDAAKILTDVKNSKMSLQDAVRWVILTKRTKNRSNKYMSEFIWIQNTFVTWCGEKSIALLSDPTIDDIELFLAEKLENEDWSARTYNNKINILTTFFNYLTAKRKLTNNPIKPGMLEKISNKAEKNRVYDLTTRKTLQPFLKKNPALRRMIQWQYYSCARGTELRGLKIKDIDLEVKKIVISAENGKTGEIVGKRNIPICEELFEIITEEKIKDLPGEWFVFGQGGKPGIKPVSHGYFSSMYFDIKRAAKIDFKYTIYSFKHTRVCDLLAAGFEPIKVMYITGHTDWGSFQKYIRELGAVMDKQLIGKTLSLNL